jgi:hypothetical protein
MSRCSVCDEIVIFSNHTCAPMWYCIHADDYSKDCCPSAECMTDEGHKIYARDAEQAAIKFAEYYQSRNSWYPSEMTIMVMDKNEEKIWKYVVYQEAVPSYSVSYMDKPEIVDAVHEGEEP